MNLNGFLHKLLIEKMTGFRFLSTVDGFRYLFKWGEFKLNKQSGFGISWHMESPDENVDRDTGKYRAHLLLFLFFCTITIKLWSGSGWDHDDMCEGIGFHFTNDESESLFINYKSKSWIISYPWSKEVYRIELLDKNGNWIPSPKHYHKLRDPDHEGLISKIKFEYVTNSGTVQPRTAWYSRERFILKYRGLPSIEKFMTSVKRVEIEFDKEVGERVETSWKGGILYISCPINDNETFEQAVNRILSGRL